MNILPMDEYDERQRKEAESQLRRARARLEIIRAQVGPRVEAMKVERSRAAGLSRREAGGAGATGRATVSSPAPASLGRHVPAPWVTHGIREPQYSKKDKRTLWVIWGVVALGCAVYVGLVLWRLWS